ncbi:MAG: TolC family protein [Candidatus Eisenbacteria bacterium]
MARKLLAFSLLLLFAALPAAPARGAAGGEAEEEIRSILEKEKVGLADLFRLAELASPTLAAAESGLRAEAGRARQAGLYPNPVIEFAVEELSTSDPGDRKDKVSLVQSLVISGRRSAAVAAARAEQEAAAQTLLSARRDVLRRVHTLWAEHLYFREAHAAIEELLRIANHTLGIAQTRFDARAAPESQVTKALLEVYELEVTRQQLAQGHAISSAELSSLLGGARVPLDRLVGVLDPDGDSTSGLLLPDALNDHPAFQGARRDIEAAEALLREARAARIPDLGLFVAYGRYRAIDEEFVEAGLTMPLPILNRNQGRVAETESLVAQARDNARIVRLDLQVTLEVARQRYMAAREQLRGAADRILPAADRGLLQAQEGYRVGHLPFLELIDAQRTFANVRLRTLELKRDAIVAEAELLSLVGTGPYGER